MRKSVQDGYGAQLYFPKPVYPHTRSEIQGSCHSAISGHLSARLTLTTPLPHLRSLRVVGCGEFSNS